MFVRVVQVWRTLFVGLLSLLLSGACYAQYVQWSSQTVVSDVTQGGLYPVAAKDAVGNLHIAYWNRQEDRLMYGLLPPGGRTVQWQRPDPNMPGGLRSAIKIDQYGQPHIAYISRHNHDQRVRYVYRNLVNQWVAEDVQTEAIGEYSAFAGQTGFVFQPSVDLVVDENDKVTIAYFNARPLDVCNQYWNAPYLELWRANKDFDGSWVNTRNGRIQWDGGGGRLQDQCYCGPINNGSVRYGESVQLLRHPDNTHNLALVNAECEGMLWEMREVNTENLFVPWQRVPVDSIWRAGLGGADTGVVRHTTSVDGIAATFSPNGTLHAVYGTSQEHGTNFALSGSTPNFFNALVYVRRDALGNSTYVTLRPNDTSPEYRNSSTIAVQGNDSIYVVYAERETGQYRLNYSLNGGLSFVGESVLMEVPGARMRAPVAVQGDSLSVIIPHAQSQSLRVGRRALDMSGEWHWSTLSLTEQRGQAMALFAEVQAGDTVQHLAYEDPLRRQLWYARRQNGGTWQPQLVHQGDTYQHLNISKTADDSLHITHVRFSDSQVWNSRGAAGQWVHQQIFTPNPVASLTAAAAQGQNQLHVVYLDQVAGQLFHRIRSTAGVSPAQLVTSEFADDFLGEYLAVAMDAQGRPHVSFWNRSQNALMYALRGAAGTWQTELVHTVPEEVLGLSTSIALTPTGQPHIAYKNVSQNHIAIARKVGINWETDVAVSGGNIEVGEPNLLQIDADGKRWLLYNTGAIEDYLVLAHWEPSEQTWEPLAIPQPDSRPGRFAAFQALDSNQLYFTARMNTPGLTGILFQHGRFYPQADDPWVSRAHADKDALNVQTWPNPFDEHINFVLASAQPQDWVLRLQDLQGRTVAQTQVRQPSPGMFQHRWQLPALASGTYLCSVVGQGRVSHTRLVKP